MSDKNQIFHLSGNKKALLRFVNQAINSIFAKYHTYPFPTGVGYVWRVGCSGTPVPNAAPPPDRTKRSFPFVAGEAPRLVRAFTRAARQGLRQRLDESNIPITPFRTST